MDNQKLNKGLLLLAWLIAQITLLLGVILQWINDEDFSKLESIIGYKWMLLTLLTIISFLLFAYFYSKTFNATKIENPTKNQVEKICPRCGEPKLKMIRSTVRTFSYRCEACNFDHRTLREGQTNTFQPE